MELKPGYKQTEAGVIPEDWGIDVIKNAYEIRNDLVCHLAKMLERKCRDLIHIMGQLKYKII